MKKDLIHQSYRHNGRPWLQNGGNGFESAMTKAVLLASEHNVFKLGYSNRHPEKLEEAFKIDNLAWGVRVLAVGQDLTRIMEMEERLIRGLRSVGIEASRNEFQPGLQPGAGPRYILFAAIETNPGCKPMTWSMSAGKRVRKCLWRLRKQC